MIWEILTQTVYQRVFVGTAIIGGTCGALGAFAYLRRQALIADVVGHSSMLGVTSAFLFSVLALGIDGRNMISIVIISTIVGVGAALLSNKLESITPLGHDATMAVILALTFGGGMALLSEINNRRFPSSKAGLKDYLFGNASTLTWFDIYVSAAFAAIALGVVLFLWRDIEIFVFDRTIAEVLGRPVTVINVALTMATVIAIVIGLKAVGLVLVVAYLILPAVSARQWVKSVRGMVTLSALTGMVASLLGALVSVSAGKVPTGPVTVIILTLFVFISLFASPQRSLIMRARKRGQARKRLLEQLRSEASSSASSAGRGLQQENRAEARPQVRAVMEGR